MLLERENVQVLESGTRGQALISNRVNVVAVFVLSVCITVRFLLFLINDNSVVYMSSIFWAGTIVVQMWPMVSTTLYEFLKNADRPPEDRKDLKRLEVPNYWIYTILLVAAILASEFGFN